MCLLNSCQDKVVNPNKNLDLEAYQSLKNDSFVVNSHRIRQQIDQLILEDNDSMTADYRCRSYYKRRNRFLWIDRHGIDSRADSLLKYISHVDRMGFDWNKFKGGQIQRDLERFRNLQFDTARNSVNRILARLEYNLTKAYLRYTAGQRFGFMNPTYVFNRLDTLDKLPTDSSKYVKFRQLFDLNMEHATKDFYSMALNKIYNDSVSEFLREVEPPSPLFRQLQEKLLSDSLSEQARTKILCNMERCRWRLLDYPQRYDKYVIVNLPSFRLKAVDGDEALSMRIGCGTLKTKTPLLYSKIKRMDINPQWALPRSIIERDVVRRLGNLGWFRNNHYFVLDRSTGKEVPLSQVSRSVLMDRRYTVIQRGGNGNSLGRIIFRFDNNFSIYLHDTDNKNFFSRDDRGVSHGCIRVEKPYELAKYMLADKNQNVLEKLHYSMTADIIPKEKVADESLSNVPEKQDTLNKKKIIKALKVDPVVPVFIIYYTIYPDPLSGKLMEYDDIYGYDSVIYKYLKNYQ